MRVVRVYRVNRERPPLPLSFSLSLLSSSYPVLRDPLRVSYARVCMSCRLGFGRHGALMNGRVSFARERDSPRENFQICVYVPAHSSLTLRPSSQRPVQPLLHPPLPSPPSAHRFVTPSFTSLRHSTPRQMNAQIYPT